MPNTGYEILQYSVCDGWVNNLLDGEKNPYVFATLEEARAELQEEFDDWNAEIQAGDRAEDDGFDICTFQIKCAATALLYALDLLEGKGAVSPAETPSRQAPKRAS